MTERFTLSPRAQGDVSAIWDYTVAHWGVAQAEAYTRQLGRHVAMVATDPALGRPCPEVRAGYFKFRSGSHLLFYKTTNDGIEVVRILHVRMNYPEHL